MQSGTVMNHWIVCYMVNFSYSKVSGIHWFARKSLLLKSSFLCTSQFTHSCSIHLVFMLKLKSGESEYISKGERSWNTFHFTKCFYYFHLHSILHYLLYCLMVITWQLLSFSLLREVFTPSNHSYTQDCI
jgi:hypothetical protein